MNVDALLSNRVAQKNKNTFFIGFLFLCCFVVNVGFSQTVQQFTSNTIFEVPCGVTSITVRAWGGGGGGASRNSDGYSAGGGGGAYAQSTFAVNEYDQYAIVVGAGGGPNNDGGTSIFGTNLIVAAGGKGVPLNGQTGGLGGNISDCVGTIRHAGGNGSNATGSATGAGGGGAGTTGNGNNAAGTTAGAARALNGGAGGAGRTNAGNGNNGNNFGGGGAGTRRTTTFSVIITGGTGGSGASGLIEIEYTAPFVASPSATGGATCGAGTVTLNASGAGAGQDYMWYTSPSGGAPFQTGGASAQVSAPTTTTYYVSIIDGVSGCQGARTPVVATFSAPAGTGLDPYTVTRATAITFATISGVGTAVTSWKNGTNRDDNMSTPINIGFDFPYDGGIQKEVMITTNGLITFNTATKANGGNIAACGTPEPYTWQNSNFSLASQLGSLQAIAPFYNDLYTNSPLNSSVYYQVIGAAPNRIMKIEWRNMYNDFTDKPDCPKLNGNLNFQVWLYETSGNIEFHYGTMQQTTWDNSSSNCTATLDNTYTIGLNSSTLTSTPNLTQLITQQTANTATFGANPVNNLTVLPSVNSRITFERTVPAPPGAAPTCIKYNYPLNFSTNQCLNQILSWADASPAATSYDVYFGTSPTPPLVGNTTHTYYDPGNLVMNTTYYWKIVPKNSFGEYTSSGTWRFSTEVGDIQPTEIISSIGTQIQHNLVGYTALGDPIYENWYEICSSMSGGVLTAVGPYLTENSELNWTNPIYFLGFPAAVCTDAPPSNVWGSCSGLTQSPILNFGSWLTAMFNGGYIIYDVFTRGCNGNSSCTRIVLKLTNTPTNGTVDNTGETICAGEDPIEFGLASLPAGADEYDYQWYEYNGVTTAPSGGSIPPGWTPVGSGGSVVGVLEEFNTVPTPPTGWTYISIDPETSCPGGASSPAARFNAQNDRIVTEMYPQAIGSISFVLGARSSSSATMLVEASSDGVSWTTIASVTRNTGTFGGCASSTYSYSLPLSANYRQVRFTRTSTGTTILSLDDVRVYFGSASYDPPAGATGSTTYAVYITPVNSNCGLPGWANSQWVVTVNNGNPAVANTWNGSKSTNWFDPLNWDCMVPICTQDVIIPNGTPHYPAINDLEGTGAECRSITINVGASLATVSNANLDVCGDWTNNGTFTPNNGTITFIGSVAQTIHTQTNFYNLTIDNSSINGVNIATNQFVDNVLTLSNGKVNTGINKVHITNNAPDKVVNGGANPGNYTNSWINGNIRRAFTTNTGIYDFPVGSANFAALAKLTNGNIGGVTSLDAWFREPLTSISPLDPAKAIDFGTPYDACYPDGYWYLEPETSTMSSGNYRIQLYFNGFSSMSAAEDDKFGIVKRPSSSSSSMDWSTQIASDGAGVLEPNGGTGRLYADGFAQRSNLIMFSHFAIAHAVNPLPIELVSFEGNCSDRMLTFQWITASETDNDFFTIEASTDGYNFETIKVIPGGGTTTSTQNYQATVNSSGLQYVYYRLKQTDFDGKHSYSNIIYVSCSGVNGDYSQTTIFPNPANEYVTIDFGFAVNGIYAISIYDVLGKEILHYQVTKESHENITVPLKVATGNYYMKIRHVLDESVVIPTQKFVVNK